MNFGIVFGMLIILFIGLSPLFCNKHTNFFLYTVSLVLAIPAFFVHPVSFQFYDTLRFSDLLAEIRSVNAISGPSGGLSWSLMSSEYAKQPLVATYIWLYSLFPEDGFLFLGTTMIFLVVLTKFVVKSRMLLNVTPKSSLMAYFLVLCMFNLFYQIEGIRNFLALLIFAVTLFLDLTEKHKRIWSYVLAYAISVLIHPMLIIFVVIRCVLLLRELMSSLSVFFDVCVGAILLSYSLLMASFLKLLQRFDSLNLINVLLSKSQVYVNGQSNYQAFANMSEIGMTSLLLIYLLFEAVLYLWLVRKKVNLYYLVVYFYIFCFVIGSFKSVQIYLRSIMLLLFLSIPLKEQIFSSEESNMEKVSVTFVYGMISVIFAVVMFAFWYVRVYSKVLV